MFIHLYTRHRRVFEIVVSVAASLLLLSATGCGAGRVSAENSRLRRELLETTDKLEAQQKQVENLKGQIAALEKKIDSPRPALPNVDVADLPVVSSIGFGKYSGAFDTTSDGADDTVRIYLHTFDQRGRFLPAAGEAVVQVVAIDPKRPPIELARHVFTPDELDNAYVSGLTGTHYTLEVKLPDKMPGDIKEGTVKVTFTDAATGADLTHQLVTPIRPGDAAPVRNQADAGEGKQ